MREGWEIIPFEKSIQKVKYTTKVPSSDYLPMGAFPIVSQEEGLISGYWNNEADVFHHSRPVVIFGDHTRIIKYVDFDFVLGADGVKILLPVDGLSAKFLTYYLRWYKVPSLGYSRHFKLLKEASIPVPPVQEQEKIVAELDCLTSIIEKKKQQLKGLDNLAQSIFYDMLGDPIANEKGWEVKLVREIASVKIGPFGSLLHAADYITGGCPVINPVHMREGRICAEADFTVSEEKRNEMSSYLLEQNDIIFGRRGDIGRCALVSAMEAGYICGTGSLFVRFTAPIIPIFALSVFMSNEMKNLLVGQAKGATMLNINCGIVEQLSVILPPLDLQNAFAQKIEAIEKQKELIKKSIQETETLFNSRMDYWFN